MDCRWKQVGRREKEEEMKRRAKGKTPSKEKRLERNYIIKGTV